MTYLINNVILYLQLEIEIKLHQSPRQVRTVEGFFGGLDVAYFVLLVAFTV